MKQNVNNDVTKDSPISKKIGGLYGGRIKQSVSEEKDRQSEGYTALSPCGPISFLGLTLRRYYLGYLLEHFNLSHLNHYICLSLLGGQTSINQSINQSIFYLDTCRPGARKLVQNTNVGYKILHGKIYINIRKQYKKN